MLYQINKGTKYFGANLIFKDIQFDIKNKEKIAIVGRNGAGKTTLLKVITHNEELDEGQIHCNSDITIGYLAQTTFADPQRKVYDELLQVFSELIAMQRRMEELTRQMKEDSSAKILDQYADLETRFAEKNGYNYLIEIKTVFTKFGFDESDLQRPVGTFSGGQKTKIAFVKLLLSQPDILLLDEPTNHLDMQTIEWLEGYLKFYPKAVILVSHDRMFLDDISEVVYELENTQLTRYAGNYTAYVNAKKLAQEKQLQAYKNQQKDIERLETLIEKFRYKKNKAAFAQSKIKYLERMEKIEAPQGDERNFHAHFQPRLKGGKRVLELRDLTIGYDHPLCTVTMSVLNGQRVAVIGPNGQGKSTLVKSIVGKLKPLAGSMMLGHQIEIGYFDQELAQINSNKTVLQELWDDHPELDKTAIRKTLGNFLFSQDDVFKAVSVLSGGEKVRLCLAKLMLMKANFLILDEPTNHLDIPGKEALEDALADYQGTILFVSHDRYFIRKMATAVLSLDRGQADYFALNYEEYMHRNDEIQPADTAAEPKKKKRETRMKQPDKAKAAAKLEQAIARQEALLETMRAKRFDPEYYHDYRKMAELDEEIDQLHNDIDRLMAEWETFYQEAE